MGGNVLLRSLLKELQKASSISQGFNQSQLYRYIVSQFRQFEHTTEQQCAPMHESMQLADTYLALLQSISRHRELVKTYRCREKTTSEAASLVGLSLPETYGEHQ